MEGNEGKMKILNYLTAAEKAAAVLAEGAPLTYFLTEKQVDYSTALLRDGVEINVFLAGFGAVNQAVLTTLVSTNQFLTADGRGVKERLVRYRVFDEDFTKLDDALSSYYRFSAMRREMDKGEYLPLPAPVAKEFFTQGKVDSPAFFAQLDERTATENAVNFVIVALGDEQENIRFARKVTAWRKENKRNFQVFVYASAFGKDGETFGEGEEEVLPFHEEDIYPLYDIERMAMRRNVAYGLERRLSRGEKLTDDMQAEAFDLAEREWNLLEPFLKKTNLYACIALRAKLHLMGLDYTYDSEKQPFFLSLAPARAIKDEEYMQIYAQGDMPDYLDESIAGKKVVRYTLDFKDSKRKNFALLEHQRWNAFMIAHGFVPATLDQIAFEKQEGKFTNGKNLLEKRHGNLTTYEGMLTFRWMVAKRDRKSEEETDVIKYDYQIMDDAVWLLKGIDGVIIEK